MDTEDAPRMAPQDATATKEDLYPHAGGPKILLPRIPTIIKRG